MDSIDLLSKYLLSFYTKNKLHINEYCLNLKQKKCNNTHVLHSNSWLLIEFYDKNAATIKLLKTRKQNLNRRL